jgi:predicted kinase
MLDSHTFIANERFAVDEDTVLYAMVGLPRSGKTTFCQKMLVPHGYVIVNPDNFRLAIHGQRFLASAEPFVWSAVYASVNALLLTGHKIVVDATNITEKRRKPWLDRHAEFILMGTTKEECLRRAWQTNDQVIIPIIERMATECDWPAAMGEKERK